MFSKNVLKILIIDGNYEVNLQFVSGNEMIGVNYSLPKNK